MNQSSTTIKVRLQHTEPGDQLSPLLEELFDGIDTRLLERYRRPHVGRNHKYKGRQATLAYMEIDVKYLRQMFELLKLHNTAA